MAQIPGAEGFGNVVAQPQRLPVNLPSGAFGAQVGQSIERVGQMRATEEEQAAREAEAQRKAAEKAKALSELQIAQDDLAALNDEVTQGVATGQIEKGQAGEEWKRRAGERVSAAMENVPADYKELGQRELGARVNRFGRHVQKAVTDRDQSDVRSGIDQTLEYAGRLYAKGDRATADQMASSVLEQLGPFSGLAPDQITKKGQAYKEASRYTYGYELVNGAKRDNGALDKVEKQLGGEEFANMDPQRKAQLMTTVEGYRVSNIQRAEVAERRRQAAAEHQLKVAESSFNAAALLVNQGKMLSPEFVAQVAKDTAGTPYGRAFSESMKDAPAKSAFGTLPLPAQQQTLLELRGRLNQAGTDPKLEKRIGELDTIYKQSVQDYTADPLPAALERGIIKAIEPVNTSSLPALAQTLAGRVAQANLVQQQTGAAVSPLTQREAEQVGELINVLPVKQRADAIAQLSEQMGGATSQAFARQVAQKDKALGLAFAAGTVRTTQGRYTSELILRGAQAIKDKTIKADDTKAVGWRAEIAAQIGDAYSSEQLREAAIESAYLVRAGLESEGGGSNSSAVHLATGGIADRNGKKVPLPSGMKEDAFGEKLKQLTPANLTRPAEQVFVAGKPMPIADFLARIPDAQLIHAGKSRYAVMAAGGLATDASGKPVVFEVR
jgi:hypothetical protein